MNKKQRDEIQQYLDECVKDGVFPGVNMLVYFQDEPNFFCCGNKAIVPNVEVNDLDTMYDLASLSKVVVTVPLIMKLIEENKLALDTRICNVLQDLKKSDIRIQDLLTHTSGLPADTPISLDYTPEEIWNMIYRCEPTTPCGEKVVYSDVGFLLLGKVIETLYKMPLNKVAEEKLFRPMNMIESSYCPRDAYKLRCAPSEDSIHFHQILRGVVHDRKAHLLGGIAGHAGVFSTVYDMAHVVEMHLHQGVYKSQTILQPSSIQAFSTVLTPPNEVKRGIGFLVKDDKSIFPEACSDVTYGHTGFAGTSMLIDPKLQIGIVILSNRIHPSRQNNLILTRRKMIHTKIYDVLKIKFQ